jgi:VanZ family protein
LRLKGWLPPLIWAGVILTGTSLPTSALPERVSDFDKVLHFTIYAVLAVLLARWFAEVTTRWRAVLLAMVITVTFGAIDEWHQQFVRGRYPERADLFADALGAAAGAFSFAALRRRATATSHTR